MRFWFSLAIAFSLSTGFIVDKTAFAQEPKKTPKVVDDDPVTPKVDKPMTPIVAKAPKTLTPSTSEKTPPFKTMETPDVAVPTPPKKTPITFTLRNAKDSKQIIARPQARVMKADGSAYPDAEEATELKIEEGVKKIFRGEISPEITTYNSKLYYKDIPFTLEFANAGTAFPKDDQPKYTSQFLEFAISVLEDGQRESLTKYDGKKLYFSVFYRKDPSSDITRFENEPKEKEMLERIYKVMAGTDDPDLSMKETRRPVFKGQELLVFFYTEKEGVAEWLGESHASRALTHLWLRHAKQVLNTERDLEVNRVARIEDAGKLVKQAKIRIVEVETFLGEDKEQPAADRKAKIAEMESTLLLLQQAGDLLKKHGKEEANVKTFNGEITDLTMRLNTTLEKLPYPFALTMPKTCTDFSLVQEGKARYALKMKGKTISRFKVIQPEFFCSGKSLALRGVLDYTMPDTAVALDPQLTKEVSTVTTVDELAKLSADDEEAIFNFEGEKLTLVVSAMKQGVVAKFEYAALSPTMNGLRMTLKDNLNLSFEASADGKIGRWRMKSPFTGDQYRFFQEKNGVKIVFVDEKEEKIVETVPSLDFKQMSLVPGAIAFLRAGKGTEKVFRVYKGSTLHAESMEKEGEKFASIEQLPKGAGFLVKLDGNSTTQIEVLVTGATARRRNVLPIGCEAFTSYANVDGTSSFAKKESEEAPLVKVKYSAFACNGNSLAILTSTLDVESKDLATDLKGKETNLTVEKARLDKKETILVVINEQTLTQLMAPAKGLTFTSVKKIEKSESSAFLLTVDGNTKFTVGLDLKGRWVAPRWLGPADSKGRYAIALQSDVSQLFFDNEWIGSISNALATSSQADELAFLASGFTPSKDVTNSPKPLKHYTPAKESKSLNRLFVLKKKDWVVEAESLDATEPFKTVEWETVFGKKVCRVGIAFKKKTALDNSLTFTADGAEPWDYLPYEKDLVAAFRIEGDVPVTVEKK